MSQKKPSAKVFLWRVYNKLKCYKTTQQYLVEITRGNRAELVDIKSSDFRNWSVRKLTANKYAISENILSTMLTKLEAKIYELGEEIELTTRVAGDDDTIYYDLYNDDGEVIEITDKGYSILNKADIDVKFIKNGNMKPQMVPVADNNFSIMELRKFFNIKEDDQFYLLLIYIISCFIPNIAHPILMVTGSQGSAKTTTNRLVKRIVDPAFADAVSLPKEKRDLIVQVSFNHMIFFDNIKHISDDYNDVLCQVSTGGYQVSRKLYSDNEVVTYKLQRCLMLNGITGFTDQPDLLDRSISILCERIESTVRVSEKELFSKFDSIMPALMHEIFSIISFAMEIKPNIKVSQLPRMADFALWGCAIANVMGMSPEEFLGIYEKNRLDIGLELLQANMTATCIIDFMKGRVQWSGSVKSFWNELDKYATKNAINKSDNTWSRNANSLGKRMEELKVNLAEQGVTFDKRNKGTCKWLTVKCK